jgi:hypothetical protein
MVGLKILAITKGRKKMASPAMIKTTSVMILPFLIINGVLSGCVDRVMLLQLIVQQLKCAVPFNVIAPEDLPFGFFEMVGEIGADLGTAHNLPVAKVRIDQCCDIPQVEKTLIRLLEP